MDFGSKAGVTGGDGGMIWGTVIRSLKDDISSLRWQWLEMDRFKSNKEKKEMDYPKCEDWDRFAALAMTRNGLF